MAKFFVGQRVRILWSNQWPELAGQEGVITGHCPGANTSGNVAQWLVAPDCWGSDETDIPGMDGCGGVFRPRDEQIVPASDSNQLSSWEAMKELWTPERLGEVV